MTANRGAVDVVLTALGHGLGERDGDALPDTGDAPSSEPPIDRIPVAILLGNVAPWRASTQSPQNAIDDIAIILGWPATAAIPKFSLNRQQNSQNTPLDLCQIAAAQGWLLESPALNQNEIHASMILSTPPSALATEVRLGATKRRCCAATRDFVTWVIDNGQKKCKIRGALQFVLQFCSRFEPHHRDLGDFHIAAEIVRIEDCFEVAKKLCPINGSICGTVASARAGRTTAEPRKSWKVKPCIFASAHALARDDPKPRSRRGATQPSQ
jgi:hypothetical protein